MFRAVEICAGAGGQALGLERAGFNHVAAVEIDHHACQTLRLNRPSWNIQETDVCDWQPSGLSDIDLFAGGVPCPPFSKAGRQLGADDERDLFPQALRLIESIEPRVIMLENVRGFLDPIFAGYRNQLLADLNQLGYNVDIKLLNASDFGVPQLRPRVVILGARKDLGIAPFFPSPSTTPPTVGETLEDLMAANGWEGARLWAQRANAIAPTLVGGSKKHGGADLGPTRSRTAWANLGVDGRGIADAAPDKNFIGMPRLTTRMAARIQGFPDSWQFSGRKTPVYRQIGNAFPPPVAEAVGLQIKKWIRER